MNDAAAEHHERSRAQIGLVYALFAYLWWGVIALYFKLIAHVPPMLVLAERVVWSVVFLIILMTLTRRWHDAREVLRDRRIVVILCFSTVLLAVNWGTFIWAVTNERALQASLGYFINPLVNVALGVIFLNERQRLGQMIGLVLAAAGVVVITVAAGALPVVALTVAISFAGYALLRKIAHVAPLEGVTIETMMLLPVAAAYILYRRVAAPVVIDWRTYGLVMLAGVMTVVPLLAFTAAARRLRLTTLGFLQYVGPTCQFLVAVLIFREPFGAKNLAGFVCIWIALLIYSIDSWRGYRDAAVAPAAVEV